MEDQSSGGFALIDYLESARRALFRSAVALVIGFTVTYWYSDRLIVFLQKPLLEILPAESRHMYYTGIADKFMIYLKISFLASIVLTLPFLLFQIWGVFANALPKAERRFAIPFLLLGTLGFFGGMSFAFFVIIPLGYKYLIEFGSPMDRPLITLTDYFSLTIQLLFATGLIFEIPVVMMLLGKLGLVTHTFLARFRRHAAFAITIIAAILSPSPDLLTYSLVVVPMYLLYELSILGVRLTGKRRAPEPA